MLFDTRAHGGFGDFEGAGFISHDADRNAYQLYSLTNADPVPSVFTGRWVGADVVFDGYEYAGGQRLASRHSITGILADSFVYTIEIASLPAELARTATIHYTRE